MQISLKELEEELDAIQSLITGKRKEVNKKTIKKIGTLINKRKGTKRPVEK